MKYTKVVPVVVALGLASGAASAATQPVHTQSLFQMTDVSSHGLLSANKDTEHKCGAGACGSAKPGEHKDAGHKCGGHKDGEHKCGSNKDGDKHGEDHDNGHHDKDHDGDKDHHDKH